MIFFCKQKTAYEVRISDWSSDVCSSDLLPCRPRMRILSPKKRRAAIFATFLSRNDIDAFERPQEENARRTRLHGGGAGGGRGFDSSQTGSHVRDPEGGSRKRSEEHTSEPQSLMRISYAVFSLKKKTTQ